ncbi:MAG: hypothetical protein OEY03_03845 [Rhizobacter sp.]|nr:hypothetical protein [Rhizobacter sp.]
MRFTTRLISAAVLADFGLAAATQVAAASRAEVQNAALWAVQFGTLHNDEASYTVVPSSERGRADVLAEMKVSTLDGSLPRSEASHTVVASTSGSKLTRAQVTAEAREAMRLGLTPVHEGHSRVATPKEAEQIRQAGLRAIDASIQFAGK